jgi:chromosome segregation ATPase
MPELTSEELALIEAGAATDDTEDEVDEILKELESQKTVSETRYNEFSERLNQCLTKLEALSAGSNAENPILIQLSNQIAEMKGVLETLKSSVDTKVLNPEPNVLIPMEAPAELSPVESIEEPSVENEEPPTPRKNRML